MPEIESKGYRLYGVSADAPSNHAQLMESRNIEYKILSDPEAALFSYVGIADSPDTIRRGIAVLSPEGDLLHQQVTDRLYSNVSEYLETITD